MCCQRSRARVPATVPVIRWGISADGEPRVNMVFKRRGQRKNAHYSRPRDKCHCTYRDWVMQELSAPRVRHRSNCSRQHNRPSLGAAAVLNQQTLGANAAVPVHRYFFQACFVMQRLCHILRTEQWMHALSEQRRLAVGLLAHAAGVVATGAVEAMGWLVLWCRIRWQRLMMAWRLVRILPELLVWLLLLEIAAVLVLLLLVAAVTDRTLAWHANWTFRVLSHMVPAFNGPD